VRAVVLEGKKQLTVKEVPTPQADGNKVLIKIERCGICGSDIHFWDMGDRVGLIMGHEFGGTVVDPGSREDLKVGDRVTALPLNPCGKCPACQKGKWNACMPALKVSPGLYPAAPGAYSEYFLSHPAMVRKLADHVSFDEAAMLEPAAVTLRAVRVIDVQPGDTVLVAGGGIIGLLAAAWAKAAGASYIALTEANPLRGENALKMGDVDAYFDARDEQVVPKLMQASGGGFDKFIECVGVAPSVNTGLAALKNGGDCLLAGVSYVPLAISTILMTIKELNIKATLGYVDEFDLALKMITNGKIELTRFISGYVGLDGVQDSFDKLTSGKYGDVKILIDPSK